MDAACAHIDERLTPYYPRFIREVTKEDILKLMEIKMGRILKFNSDKAEELIARMKADIEEIDHHLANIVEYTVDWYLMPVSYTHLSRFFTSFLQYIYSGV